MAGGFRERARALSPAMRQAIRFGLVGGLGTVTNLVLFFALVDLGPVGPLIGAGRGFCGAVSQNYVLNELWTFASEADGALSFRRYGRFIAASLIGLGVNGSVLVILLWLFEFPWLVIPQAIGIAAGMTLNFVASRRIVFRRD